MLAKYASENIPLNDILLFPLQGIQSRLDLAVLVMFNPDIVVDARNFLRRNSTASASRSLQVRVREVRKPFVEDRSVPPAAYPHGI